MRLFTCVFECGIFSYKSIPLLYVELTLRLRPHGHEGRALPYKKRKNRWQTWPSTCYIHVETLKAKQCTDFGLHLLYLYHIKTNDKKNSFISWSWIANNFNFGFLRWWSCGPQIFQTTLKSNGLKSKKQEKLVIPKIFFIFYIPNYCCQKCGWSTVVCIKVRTASFPRFWKNHP